MKALKIHMAAPAGTKWRLTLCGTGAGKNVERGRCYARTDNIAEVNCRLCLELIRK